MIKYKNSKSDVSIKQDYPLRNIDRKAPWRSIIRSRADLSSKNVNSDRFIPQVRSRTELRIGTGTLKTQKTSASPTHPEILHKFNKILSSENAMQSTYISRMANALGFEEHEKIMKFGQFVSIPGHKQSLNFISTNKDGNKTRTRLFELTRILDAPGLVNDFYASPLSWSHKNALAISLADEVYIWKENSVPKKLPNCSTSDIFCLAWSTLGRVLAIGAENGQFSILRSDGCSILFTSNLCDLYGTPCCFAWKPISAGKIEYLLVGMSTGKVLCYRIEPRASTYTSYTTSLISVVKYHTDQICGIAWNCDGTQFSTGANDNTVVVCNFSGTKVSKHLILKHNAAVKALSFCPWKKSLLMTGSDLFYFYVIFIFFIYVIYFIYFIFWVPMFMHRG